MLIWNYKEVTAGTPALAYDRAGKTLCPFCGVAVRNVETLDNSDDDPYASDSSADRRSLNACSAIDFG
jgi:hypothetical protein